MMNFKVGDKVIFNKENAHVAKEFDYKTNHPYEVKEVYELSKTIRIINENSENHFFEEERFELFETKPTKNQRITALENEVAELRPLKQEVAELKLIIHELRDGRKTMRDVMNEVLSEPSTTNTVEHIEFEGQQYRKVDRKARVGDVVIFREKGKRFIGKGTYITIGNPYKVSLTDDDGCVKFIDDDEDDILVYGTSVNRTPETVDVYELIKEGLNPQIPIVDETIEPLTPNQQRAAIIEKAKEFVKNIVGEYDTFDTTVGRYKDQCVRPIFRVNQKKRAITVLIYGAFSKELIFKGITKCHPSNVFNEHIGKAIALGRALGLDVSEFEQAVQPNKVVSGMKIKSTMSEIIDDTNAIY